MCLDESLDVQKLRSVELCRCDVQGRVDGMSLGLSGWSSELCFPTQKLGDTKKRAVGCVQGPRLGC